MTEFIGARISLISKSDIRYVGTLHEINSGASTVALENVTSFGTEGRRGNPDEEIPSSDNVYEYIVFRGSDVKDLRIEGPPVAKENKPPTPPNDPAIMSSSGSRPAPIGPGPHPQRQAAPASQPPPQAPQAAQAPPAPQGPQQGPQAAASQGPSPPAGPPPQFGHHNPQYPPFYPGPPMPQGWGRGGPPPPFGMPYGAPPPGWFPPPGQGFPPGPPGHFSPYGYAPPNQHFQQQQQQGPNQAQSPRPAPIGPGSNKPTSPPSTGLDKQPEPKNPGKTDAEVAATSTASEVPKVTPAASQATPSAGSSSAQKPADKGPSASQSAATAALAKSGSAAPKSNRVQPAIPLKSPAPIKTPLQSNAGNVTQQAQTQAIPVSLKDATQAATAAVAAAMAKLPTSAQTNGNAMDNLTKKVNEMRTNEPIRAPRNPGSSGDRGGFERGRGRGRGGAPRTSSQKVDVPATDFDFETSNAKFNKEDLVKEAIAGSPLGEQAVASPTDPDVPAPAYSKTTSFFDNISSDHKDRMEASGGGKAGGREWRGEEQKKNVETFGQGSVDNGYRGAFRGRGRGRGRGGFRRGNFGGNGQPAREGGGYRGPLVSEQ